jgi:hypothetical protein
MMEVHNAVCTVLDRHTLAELAKVTLRHFRRDGLRPTVFELIRHIEPHTRNKIAAAA